MGTPAAIPAREREALVRSAGRAPGAVELFGAASERLRRLVPFDAAVWMAADPGTGLPTAPTVLDGIGHLDGPEECMRVWELEFLVEDVNLYRDLARAPTPAGGLRLATGDRPARSSRFRELVAPLGFDDELRAAMRAGGHPWGYLSLVRRSDLPAFDDGDAAIVGALAEPLGEALRELARPAPAPAAPGPGRGPGLMVVSPSGEIVSANDDGLAWLDELPRGPGEGSFGADLPIVVMSTAMRARAVAEAREHGPARARLRSRATGRWLVCHASCLRDADGRIGDTALVIEPATAAEVAPIVVQAYDLSPREREITALIARGYGTAEMAGRLHLSAHTVRDYVKAVLEKVGVSSRGELVARLFAEHYAPAHLDPAATTLIDP